MSLSVECVGATPPEGVEASAAGGGGSQSLPPKKQKGRRSGQFPPISLPETLEFVRRFYEHNKNHGVPHGVAIVAMGFSSPKSGSGAITLSAARKFGLMEISEGLWRVTEAAMRLLEESVETYPNIVLTLAKRPSVFRAMIERYGDTVPSRGAAVVFLRMECRLTNDAPEKCWRAFVLTARFVQEVCGDAADFPKPNPSNDHELEGIPTVGHRIHQWSGRAVKLKKAATNGASNGSGGGATAAAAAVVKPQQEEPSNPASHSMVTTTPPARVVPLKEVDPAPITDDLGERETLEAGSRKLQVIVPIDPRFAVDEEEESSLELYIKGNARLPATTKRQISDAIWPILNPVGGEAPGDS